MTVWDAGNDVRLDWDDAGASFSPSAPVSGTGTGLSPLSSRERGILSVVLACYRPALWILP